MAVPNIIWMIFLFMLGASVGSFINVVVYRLPKELSIVRPGSHCTSCEHPIGWYDNVPVLSWFLLRGRCRHCGAGFSIRYALVELLTGLLFVFLFWAYFIRGVREGMPAVSDGGWMVYVGHIVLVAVLLISSLIDAEHWHIPLSVVYVAVAAALIMSGLCPYWVEAGADQFNQLTPWASVKTGALALGALFGLIIAIILLELGIIKASDEEIEENSEADEEKDKELRVIPPELIRRDMLREMVFLLPVAGGAVAFYLVLTGEGMLSEWWGGFIVGQKWALGLLGSIFGFMIGGAVVWATRIGGSLAFGKEAMGLGDVHLMAGVGAMLGWTSPTIAFFVAPFMGLGWAVAQLVVHKSREIPYGPFLSAATLVVMLTHDSIVSYFMQAFMVEPYPGTL